MILQEAAIPYNGSGSFTLAEAPFVPNTPIQSSSVNSDLSDIATNGLTNAVTKDGQTTITGAFKGASGSVGLPMYSFSADTDSGMYRIAANNIGISVNATKILDIATTGLSLTGALAVSGSLSVSGAQTFTGQASFPAGFLSGDGTVLLPAWSFTSDPDSGVYRIGANNIGVAVNAAKVLDIGTTGLSVTGSVSSNGTALVPQPQAAGMVNGTIVESHTGNAVTYAIKTLAGGDPSATDIVYFVFRNATAATGNYTAIQVTAALSLVVSSGSTLGTASSNIPFKLWLVAFNDAGTVRLGIINNVLGGATPTSIYPLGQVAIASSTAEGGAGGADSAQVFYTGTAVSSKPYLILGYASYETGVTTAGAWASSPTRLQLFGDGVPLPGTVIQPRFFTSTTPTTINSTSKIATALADSIMPTSAANLLKLEATGFATAVTAGPFTNYQIYRGTGTTAVGTTSCLRGNAGGAVGSQMYCCGFDLANSSSSIQYGLYGVLSTGSTSEIFLDNAGFTQTGSLSITEIMA